MEGRREGGRVRERKREGGGRERQREKEGEKERGRGRGRWGKRCTCNDTTVRALSQSLGLPSMVACS